MRTSPASRKFSFLKKVTMTSTSAWLVGQITLETQLYDHKIDVVSMVS
jgi:hypothetical protein